MSFEIGASVFWTDHISGLVWSAVIVERFMLGGPCVTVQLDGIVKPGPLPSSADVVLKPNGKFKCFVYCVPAVQLRERTPQPDDERMREEWETFSPT